MGHIRRRHLAHFAEALRLAADQQEELERQNAQIIAMSGRIEKMQPKADYYDAILRSPNPIVITQIAKDYGMSPQELNKRLKAIGVQYKVNGQWVLYAKYQGCEYTTSQTGKKRNSDDTWISSVWTQKGRLFLYERLKSVGLLPIIERGKGYSLPSIDDIDEELLQDDWIYR